MRPLLLLLLICSLLAVEEESAPVLSVSLPDVQRTMVRYKDSIYGALWNDPQLAPLISQRFPAGSETLGIGNEELLKNLRNASLRFQGFAPTEGDGIPRTLFEAIFLSGHRGAPHGSFTLDLGSMADEVCSALRKNVLSVDATQVPGADETIQFAEGLQVRIARFGEVLAGATSLAAPIPWAIPADDADAVGECDVRRLLESLRGAISKTVREGLESIVAPVKPFLGTVTYRAWIAKEGLLERISVADPCLWMKPVDRAVLDRLPQTTLAALAFGLDGKRLWAAVKDPLLSTIAKQRGSDAALALESLNQELRSAGFDFTYPEMIEGIDGTFAVAVAPGAPFPSLTVVLPRSRSIDTLLVTLLGMVDCTVPNEGTWAALLIPNLPLPLTLSRDASGWMLTSDAVFAADWLARKGGFLTSPAAKLAVERGGADAVVLGCSDTPALLRTAIPYMAMALGQAPLLEADQRQGFMKMLQTLAVKTSTGYVVAKPDRGGMTLETRGLISVFHYVALPILGLTSLIVYTVKEEIEEPPIRVQVLPPPPRPAPGVER